MPSRVVRWLDDEGRGSASKRSADKAPIDILEERFAHGEIDTDELEVGLY